MIKIHSMAFALTNKIKKYEPVALDPGTNKSPDERERLITEYAPLVKNIAGRLAMKLPQHIGQDDLKSAGIMGLLDAIEKFDPGKGVSFRSYAEFRIRGAMIDELRSMDWVPRSVRKSAKRLENAYARVENLKMRPASDEEVATELGLDLESFYKFLDDAKGISILNEYDALHNIPQTDTSSRDTYNLKAESHNPLDSLNVAEIRNTITDAIERLPQNERTVIALYYYEELTMKEIGNVMGYTESRVSQLHTKAALRLRASLKAYFDR